MIKVSYYGRGVKYQKQVKIVVDMVKSCYNASDKFGTAVRTERIRRNRQEEENMYSLDEVKSVDPEIAQAIVDEQTRQNSTLS